MLRTSQIAHLSLCMLRLCFDEFTQDASELSGMLNPLRHGRLAKCKLVSEVFQHWVACSRSSIHTTRSMCSIPDDKPEVWAKSVHCCSTASQISTAKHFSTATLGCEKQARGTWCLSEALKKQAQLKRKSWCTFSLMRDESKGRLLLRM